MKNLFEIVLNKKFDEINEYTQGIKIPEKCPVCNRDTSPSLIGYVNGKNGEIHVLFYCALPNCGHLFYVKHQSVDTIKNYSGLTVGYVYKSTDTFPVIPKRISFNNEISSNFPDFLRIYNEASSAEDYKLFEIAGMGYRKALEFLVKDFLINHCNRDRAVIERKFLGKCISEEIENQKIRDCAERAMWLGNDEAHYKRKWEEKDIESLKSIIKMLVNFVENEIAYPNLVEKDMPEGR